ncbi:transmembrane protein 179B-like [Antedon mediterranea]|uniref:transmembrane protein 179B-like n=1 Tax=Antedon mediterranea TaxID=105859 RepID=UPI003AF7C582
MFCGYPVIFIMADRKEIMWDIGRLALLFVTFASGITVILIILTFKGERGGHCIILSDMKWYDGSSSCDEGIEHCFNLPTRPGCCSYIINSQAAACAFSCMWFIFFIVKLVTKKEYARRCRLKLMAISSIIYAVLGFISACILLVGLHKLCKGLQSGPILDQPCGLFQTNVIWKYGKNDHFYFIKYFHSGQITSWISCICWLVLFITSVIQLKLHGGGNQTLENETDVVI